MKSKKVTKKLLSLIIASIMIVTMLPVSAFAAESDVMIEDQAEAIVEEAADVSGEVVEEAAEVPDIENSEDAAIVEGAVDELEEADPEELTGYTETLSFTAQGVPSGSKMHFDAQLTGLSVSAVVPAKRAAKGSVMTADIVDVSADEDAIAKKNYGKSIAGLYGLELHFYDKKGKEIKHINTSDITVTVDGLEASSYFIGRIDNKVKKIQRGTEPTFTFTEKKAYTYVIAGLEDDGLIRATAETDRKGNKRFNLNEEKVNIEVVAPKGAFAEGVAMEASDVTNGANEDGEEALVGASSDEVVAAYEISFYNEDGDEQQPSKGVAVTINTPLDMTKSYKLIHIADDGTSNEVEGAKFTENGVEFVADSFSVYAVVWTDAQGNEQSAEIHWGYQEGDTFNEFTDTASLDSNAATMSLDVIFDGYMYGSATYKKGNTEYSLASNTLTKVTGESGATTWTMQANVPTGEGDQTAVQTMTIESDADIYAYYVRKAATPTPPPSDPTTVKGPITKKSVTRNDDGTYTVRLDITGQKDTSTTKIGANVIIVMDRTYSMTYDIDGGDSRMDAAKDALTTLINTLNPGTGANQNLINFTAVEFANGANYVDGRSWTTSKTDMLNYVNGLSAWSWGHNPDGWGTCWQAGLYGGYDRAKGVSSNANLNKNKTYIIFVTDGDPNGYYTNYNSDGGPKTNPGYVAPPDGNFVQNAYTLSFLNAYNASTIVENRFYGVYCGSATDPGKTRLTNLMNGSYQGNQINGKFVDGTNHDAIVSAFENIATTIVNDLGANNIVVDDGVPTLANVSAAVSGTAGGFEYFIKPKGGTERPWDEAPSAGYSSSNGVTWDLSPAGVLADGTVYSLEFTVWPTQDAYDLLANLNNNIEGWRLNELDDATREQLVVEVNGVKYGYTSGQTANSGTWAPESGSPSYTTDQLLSRISNASSVTYNVLTNTHLSTTYKYGDDTYSDPPVGGINSKAMLLQDQKITVQKKWHNELDAKEASETTLTITKDGANYIPVVMGEPEKTGAHEWTQSPTTELYISCGFMTVSGDNVTVKSSGHDYTVTEPAELSWYWDLTADVYHPMVIDGRNTMLIEVTDEQMNAEGFPAEIKTLGNNKTKTSGGKKYYKFGGNLYVEQSGSNILHAYNDRRSRLLVSKQVTGSDAPADAMFKFTVNMENTYAKYSNEEGYNRDIDGFWFVVVKDPNADLENLIQLPNAIARTTDGLVVTDATAQAGNTGYYWFDNVQGGKSATISIKAGWRIYFPNVGRGADYSVEELGGTDMPEGFVFEQVVPDAVSYKTGETSTPGTVDSNNGMKVNGSFDKSNTIYSAAYTNSYKGVFYVYHSGDCSVERYPMAVNGVAYGQKKKFDIHALTATDKLYGGYYSDYAGKSSGFNAAAAKALDYSGEEDPKDKGGKAYSYAYIKDSNKDAWSYSNGYDVDGTAMVPQKDTVYYLKEVPDGYLRPYTHYTYFLDDYRIGTAWTITDTDDLCYSKAGFMVRTDNKVAKIVASMTIAPENRSYSTVTLTAGKVFKPKGVLDGWLGYADITGYIDGSKAVIQQYWETKDGIEVFGVKQRELTFTADDSGQYTKFGIVKSDTDYSAS